MWSCENNSGISWTIYWTNINLNPKLYAGNRKFNKTLKCLVVFKQTWKHSWSQKVAVSKNI